MNYNEFCEYAKTYNLIPVYKIITADMLTPVLAYLKVRDKQSTAFLLESVEGNVNMARFSFIGKDPELIIKNKKNDIIIENKNKKEETSGNIFDVITKELNKYKQPKIEELPAFSGGLCGFIGYENIQQIEPTVITKNKGIENYDSILGLFKTLIAFDHYKHQVILISNVTIKDETNLNNAYQDALDNISNLSSLLNNTISYKSDFSLLSETECNTEDKEFFEMVEKSKYHIIEGDIFQIVLSKRYFAQYKGDTFNVYRALRIINPSPYMYYFEYPDGLSIMGTSPENLVKIYDRNVQLLPIAGTRRRGKTKEEDIMLEENLINDKKELAEHTMLVDLGRNDLGRVCKYGTIEVVEQMKIQRYSHVMHIVSKVEGELTEDKHIVDALKSCFPAGTVTGAPKIKAMQLIEQFERTERNIYAGAVGYFDFKGNMDMCIAIRTLFAKDNTIYWQSGAGIVADSKPELESKEINNKAAVMIKALKFAEVIDENFSN
ncbi:MAG TPA: anthranilate synthase component I [Melioribacteraceae bacterium]|nr:anthranilate synthase component I [Melioribacteraceae bacterium]